jgi:hypothetical protein
MVTSAIFIASVRDEAAQMVLRVALSLITEYPSHAQDWAIHFRRPPFMGWAQAKQRHLDLTRTNCAGLHPGDTPAYRIVRFATSPLPTTCQKWPKSSFFEIGE